MIRILKALHLYGIWTVVGMFFVNHLFAGTRFFSIKRKLLRSMGHQIGNDTKVVAPLTTTVKLKIGDNCWIGREFAAYGNGTVTIGNCCDIAPRVSFHTGGHEFGTSERRAGIGRIYHITVGDGCWLGGEYNCRDYNSGQGLYGCSLRLRGQGYGR